MVDFNAELQVSNIVFERLLRTESKKKMGRSLVLFNLFLLIQMELSIGAVNHELKTILNNFTNSIIFNRGMTLNNGTLSISEFESYLGHLQHLNKVLVATQTTDYDCSENVNFANGVLGPCNSSVAECGIFAQLLQFVKENSSSDRISVESFQDVCPILLHQLEIGSCSMEVETTTKPTPLEVWGYGFLFVTIINLSSVFGAVLLPLMGKKFFNRLLIVLIGLAVGSLSSSAAFHLIPQAYGLLDTVSVGGHNYLFISLLILCGIYLFFMVERFLKIFIEYKKHKQECKHEHQIDFKPGQDSAIATVAWMIVFGDGLHNFIDGLSIGAAFNESILTGISISVAVICEELPHELGDLAVLLNSGMTIKQALLYNFLSACTCYLGLITGTLLGELAAASMYIFALAGGVFLYISLVDMIPEMNHEVESASKDGVWDAIKVVGLQNIGWITGTAILFILAYYADNLTFA